MAKVGKRTPKGRKKEKKPVGTSWDSVREKSVTYGKTGKKNRQEAREDVSKTAKRAGSAVKSNLSVNEKKTPKTQTTKRDGYKGGSRSGAIKPASTTATQRRAGAVRARQNDDVKTAVNVTKIKPKVKNYINPEQDAFNGKSGKYDPKKFTAAQNAFNRSKAAQEALNKAGRKTVQVDSAQETRDKASSIYKSNTQAESNQLKQVYNFLAKDAGKVYDDFVSQYGADAVTAQLGSKDDFVKSNYGSKKEYVSKGLKETEKDRHKGAVEEAKGSGKYTYSKAPESVNQALIEQNASLLQNNKVKTKTDKDDYVTDKDGNIKYDIKFGKDGKLKIEPKKKKGKQKVETTQGANIIDYYAGGFNEDGQLTNQNGSQRVANTRAGWIHDAPFMTGVMQGFGRADIKRGLGQYSDAAAKDVDKTTSSGAFMGGYMTGFGLQFPFMQVNKMTDAMVRGVTKAGLERSALNIGARKGVAAATTEMPMNMLDALKMSTDAKGNVDKGSFGTWAVVNTLLSGGMGGVIGGVGSKMTKATAREYLTLAAKARSGLELSDDELARLQTLDKKLESAKNGYNIANSDIAYKADYDEQVMRKVFEKGGSVDDAIKTLDGAGTNVEKMNYASSIKQEANMQFEQLRAQRESMLQAAKNMSEEDAAVMIREANGLTREIDRLGELVNVAEQQLAISEKRNRTALNSLTKSLDGMSEKTGVNYRVVNDKDMRKIIAEQGEDVSDNYFYKGFYYKDADGKVNILINSESPQAHQTVIGHETGHLIKSANETEFFKLGKDLENYAKKMGDWDAVYDQLKRAYPEASRKELREEVTCELLGRYVFGNDDTFIKQLAKEQPSVLQKIVEYFKKLLSGTTDKEMSKELQTIIEKTEKLVGKINPNAEVKGSKKSAENVGYHAGDLGKAESMGNQTGGRGTGHFGTGTYFVGNKVKISDGSYGKRPVETVNFDKYNLYKPRNTEEAYELHDFLRDVNDYFELVDSPQTKRGYARGISKKADDLDYRLWDAEEDLHELEQSVKSMDDDALLAADVAEQKVNELRREVYDLGESALGEYRVRQIIKDEDPSNLSRESANEILYELQNPNSGGWYSNWERKLDSISSFYDGLDIWAIRLNTSKDKLLESLRKAKKQSEDMPWGDERRSVSDSASTILMKDLGYEGVDVRHTDLDNTSYGSVIYDLKDEDLARKQEIGTARFSKEQKPSEAKIPTEVSIKMGDQEYLGFKLKHDPSIRGEAKLDGDTISVSDAFFKADAKRQKNALAEQIADRTLKNLLDREGSSRLMDRGIFGKYVTPEPPKDRPWARQESYFEDIFGKKTSLENSIYNSARLYITEPEYLKNSSMKAYKFMDNYYNEYGFVDQFKRKDFRYPEDDLKFSKDVNANGVDKLNAGQYNRNGGNVNETAERGTENLRGTSQEVRENAERAGKSQTRGGGEQNATVGAGGLGRNAISQEAQNSLAKHGIRVGHVADVSPEPDGFIKRLQKNANSQKFGVAVDTDLKAQDLKGAKLYTASNGDVTIGVKPDGDIFGLAKNSASHDPQAFTDAMFAAIANGGVKMDNYGRHLTNMYAQFGFEPVARLAYNPEYISDAAKPIFEEMQARGITPDVYVMKHNGDSLEEIARKRANGEYKTWAQDELDALRTFDDYDEALSYRDGLLNTNKTEQRFSKEQVDKSSRLFAPVGKDGLRSKAWEVVANDLKGEKFSAKDLPKMLTNSKYGVKEEELKWTGLEAFLDGKKSVSKQELMDFFASNTGELTTVKRGDPRDLRDVNNELKEVLSKNKDLYDELYEKTLEAEREADKTLERLGATPYKETPEERARETLEKDPWDAFADTGYTDAEIEKLTGIKMETYNLPDPIYKTYMLDGAENYREYEYIMAGNKYQSGHWNEKGVVIHSRIGDFSAETLNDGAVSHEEVIGLKNKIIDSADSGGDIDVSFSVGDWKVEAFGSTEEEYLRVNVIKSDNDFENLTYWTDEMNGSFEERIDKILSRVDRQLSSETDRLGKGGRTLYVDEIQSDLHNKGHKYGYEGDGTSDALRAEKEEVWKKYQDVTKKVNDYRRAIQDIEETEEMSRLRERGKAIADKIHDIREQARKDGENILSEDWYPSEKYRNEYETLQRRLRDVDDEMGESRELAQLRNKELYDKYHEFGEEQAELSRKYADLDKKVGESLKAPPDAPYKKNYTDYAMKRALREAVENDYEYLAWSTGKIHDKRWGGALDYTVEYDTIIPKFMKKYVKQWNGKVEKIRLAENGEEVWAVKITPEMRESVSSQGQYRFSKERKAPLKSAESSVETAGARLDELKAARTAEEETSSNLARKQRNTAMFSNAENKAERLKEIKAQKAESDAKLAEIDKQIKAVNKEIAEAQKVIDENADRLASGRKAKTAEQVAKWQSEIKGFEDEISSKRAEIAELDKANISKMSSIEADGHLDKRNALVHEIEELQSKIEARNDNIQKKTLLPSQRDALAKSGEQPAPATPAPKKPRTPAPATPVVESPPKATATKGSKASSFRDSDEYKTFTNTPSSYASNRLKEFTESGIDYGIDLAPRIKEFNDLNKQIRGLKGRISNSKTPEHIAQYSADIEAAEVRQTAIARSIYQDVANKRLAVAGVDATSAREIGKAIENVGGVNTIAKDIKKSSTGAGSKKAQKLVAEEIKDYNSCLESYLKGGEDLDLQNARASALLDNISERLAKNPDDTGAMDDLMKVIDKLSDDGTVPTSIRNSNYEILASTPKGRVGMALKAVDDLNKKYGDRINGTLKLTEAEKVDLATMTGDELANRYKEITERLWDEIPATRIEKINEIRHMFMLLNVRTHARNMFGNFSFGGVKLVADELEAALQNKVFRGAIEKRGGEVDRVHVNRGEVRENKDFLTDEFHAIYDKSDSKTRWKETNRPDGVPTVKMKALNWLIQKDYHLLENEDMLRFIPEFRKSYVQYVTAKDKTAQAIIAKGGKAERWNLDSLTDAQKKMARERALFDAEYATFRDTSALSAFLTGKKHLLATKQGKTVWETAAYRMGNMALEGVLPFVKTPVNIFRRSVDYSPISLIRCVGEMASKDPEVFKQGIRHLSSGLTGTGVFALGVYLAQSDFISIDTRLGQHSGSKYYDQDMGYQDYSLVINVGGKKQSWTIDFLQPMQASLFMGAAFKDMVSHIKDGEGNIGTDAIAALFAVTSPMLDASFMSSTKDMIETFQRRAGKETSEGEPDMAGAVAQALFGDVPKNYISSAVPQLISQAANVTDKYKRDTRSTMEDPILASWDSAGKQMINRIPVLRNKLLNPKLDRWGDDIKTGNNIATRLLYSMINPSNVKDITENKYDRELIKIRNNGLEKGSKDYKNFFYNFTGNPNYELANGKRMSYDDLYKYGKYNRQEQTKIVKAMVDSTDYKEVEWDKPSKKYAFYAGEVDDAHWIGQMVADHDTYGINYALKAMKKNKDTNSRDESDLAVYNTYTRNAGKDKDNEAFWSWRIAKEELYARSHPKGTDESYRIKGICAIQTGDDNLVKSMNLEGNKEPELRKYWNGLINDAKERGLKGKKAREQAKQVAFEEMSTFCSFTSSYLENEDVSATHLGMISSSAGLSAVKGKKMPERIYRAMGQFWNSAQAGGGIMLKYNKDGKYDLKNLEAYGEELSYRLENKRDGEKEKDIVQDFIENDLGVTDADEAACVYQTLYLKGNGKRWKNPYKETIDDHLEWGENHDEDWGIGGDGKSGGRGRRGRRGGHGGGGGGSSKGAMPKTESGAIKGKVTNPFSSSDTTTDSNLNDAYRKRLHSLIEKSHKR